MYGKHLPEESKIKMSVAKKGKHTGEDHHNSKPVICIDTKQVYSAAATASKVTGVNKAHICSCCNNVRKHAGGFQWKLIYDTTRKNGEFIPGAITLGIITEEEVLKQLNKQQND